MNKIGIMNGISLEQITAAVRKNTEPQVRPKKNKSLVIFRGGNKIAVGGEACCSSLLPLLLPLPEILYRGGVLF